MAVKHNNSLPKNHFKKDWKSNVRTYFNQPMRAKRRAQKRRAKAARLAPRPASGPLRPLVSACTRRYTGKIRLGRGFSREELKLLGLNLMYARSIGIAVDCRRRNKSVESVQRNVERLKEYKSRLILFPRKVGKPRKNDASEAEMKMATQNKDKKLMFKKESPQIEDMALTEELKAFKVFRAQRRARYGQWRAGKRQEAKAKLEQQTTAKK
ncbi:hypothetical protein ACOME3_010824 [Neoechinorhynchus agilis]